MTVDEEIAAACPLIFQKGLTAARTTTPPTTARTMAVTLAGAPAAARHQQPRPDGDQGHDQHGGALLAVADVVVADASQPDQDEQQAQRQQADKQGGQRPVAHVFRETPAWSAGSAAAGH